MTLATRHIPTGSQIARLSHAVVRDATTAMLHDGFFAPRMGTASGGDIDALLLKGSAK